MIPYTYDFDYYVGDTYPVVIYDGSVEEKGIFVALPFGGSIWENSAISTDAITWTLVPLPTNNLWFDTTYGNGRFVSCVSFSYAQVVATSSISENSIIWTARTLPVSSNWASITFGNNVFVTIGRSSFTPSPIAISTDGITWVRRTMIPSSPSIQWTVNYGNGIFVAVSNYSSARSAASTNGVTWTQGTMPAGTDWHESVYGNNVFVSVRKNVNISAYSTNGTSWTQTTLPASADWTGMAYNNGHFVVIARGPSLVSLSSTNGITWTQGTMTENIGWWGVTYSNGFFYATGGSNRLSKSTDGITWQTCPNMPSGGSGGWRTIIYQDALYPNNITYSLNKTGLFTVSTERGNPSAEIFSVSLSTSYPEYRLTAEITPELGSLLTGASYVYDIEVKDDDETYTLLTGTITTQQDVKSN